jgi:UMF1 family MFS transporter
MISFVFSVYVTGTVAGDSARGQTTWADAQTLTGLVLALLAPLMGAWADRSRNRRAMLTVATLLVIVCIAGGWFVRPHPEYLTLGVGLLAVAAVISEIGAVFYNGMLLQISDKTNIGRVSAIGWGAGYLGGVLCLVMVLFGFVLNGGLLGLPRTDLVNIRAVALFAAAFMLVFCLPVMLWGPNRAEVRDRESFGVLTAYRDIGRRIGRMWRDERGLLHFLIASAVFRDGLVAVFSFGGVIAAASYGFSQTEVIYFGLAANVIALAGTWGLSGLDDRFGPRWVIIGALLVMIVAGFVLIAVHTSVSFWVCGLVISSQVGLVQSASRTLLARIAPPGEENETFGLYATTGRVASFIAPALVGLFTRLLGVDWGILGIVATLALGLAIFAPLRIRGVTHDRA